MINSTRYRLDAEVRRQNRLASDIARGQIQISTNKRLLAPSDDPAASVQISQIGLQQGKEAAWIANLANAAVLASRGDQALGSLETGITRVQELLVSAATGTLSAQNRETIAIELRSIAVEINALSDTRDARGEPLFRTNGSLEIPVSDGISVAPVGSRTAIFGSVQTGTGVTDLASIVEAAADAIELADPAARSAAVAASLGAAQAAVDHVGSIRSDQGIRGARIDALADRLALTSLQLADERAGLEATDIPETIARITAKKLSLDAAQAIFARLNQSSLFDLLT